jgi:hypothetical protein
MRPAFDAKCVGFQIPVILENDKVVLARWRDPERSFLPAYSTVTSTRLPACLEVLDLEFVGSTETSSLKGSIIVVLHDDDVGVAICFPFVKEWSKRGGVAPIIA